MTEENGNGGIGSGREGGGEPRRERNGAEHRFRTLADLSVGTPMVSGGLGIVPLSGLPAAGFEYRLVDEALAAKEAVVEEVSESGSVPELRLTNFSEFVLLVVDGTELVGAKQNRIVNASFLIPPKSVTTIPVSCVEQGRWGYRQRTFGDSEHFAAQSIRKEKAMFQHRRRHEGFGHASDQGKVWQRVEELSSRLGARSETSSLHDVYEQRRASLDAAKERFRLEGGECGLTFFVHGKFRGLELFDRPATLGRLFPKLLSAISIEALAEEPRQLDAGRRSRTPEEMAAYARRILEDVGRSLFDRVPSIGIGEDWRFEGRRCIGKALYRDADLVHLAAFDR